MQKVTNFRRFYALLKRMPGADKKLLIYQHTGGRTDSLRELSPLEYRILCIGMDRIIYHELRTWRSNVLTLLNNMGIIGWPRIDALCLSPRIAGKLFIELDTEELKALHKKLHSIEAKGGIKQKVQSGVGTSVRYTFIFHDTIKN